MNRSASASFDEVPVQRVGSSITEPIIDDCHHLQLSLSAPDRYEDGLHHFGATFRRPRHEAMRPSSERFDLSSSAEAG